MKAREMLGWRGLALATSLGAIALTGCGGDGDEEKKGEEAAGGAPVETVNVSETDFKLNPADPKIAKSGVIAFKATNDGKVDHSLEIEAKGEEFEIEEPIKPGDSATLKAKLEPGTYEWYCPIDDHKGKGMKGEITVEGGKASGGASSKKGEESGGGGGGGGGYSSP
jgi:uncharacterized cupredoxin-like copper-binding protein